MHPVLGTTYRVNTIKTSDSTESGQLREEILRENRAAKAQHKKGLPDGGDVGGTAPCSATEVDNSGGQKRAHEADDDGSATGTSSDSSSERSRQRAAKKYKKSKNDTRAKKCKKDKAGVEDQNERKKRMKEEDQQRLRDHREAERALTKAINDANKLAAQTMSKTSPLILALERKLADSRLPKVPVFVQKDAKTSLTKCKQWDDAARSILEGNPKAGSKNSLPDLKDVCTEVAQAKKTDALFGQMLSMVEKFNHR